MNLDGVIDLHAHCGPDSMPRILDAIDVAHNARAAGMTAVVLKNHFEPTASMAYFARKAVPDIEVFGGIALNLSVGGMNPHAVEHMAKVTGGWGRIVWMPTFDSEAQVRYSRENRPFVSISPAIHEVIDAIARHNLILATGHSSAAECLLLVREAQRRGVPVIVTHAMMAPIHMTIPQMQECASMGAYIEFVYNGIIGPFKEFELPDYARAIRAIGAEHAILASDLGQPVNPPHTDGLKTYFEGLMQAGITESDIDLMTRRNPAQLLKIKTEVATSV